MRIRASVLAGPYGNNACFAPSARRRWAAFKHNAAGDVAFLTQLGSKVDGVAKLEEVRATVRRADGTLVTIASTRHAAQFGALSAMQIVGYNEAGTLLLIAARGRSSDRVLLMGRSDQ